MNIIQVPFSILTLLIPVRHSSSAQQRFVWKAEDWGAAGGWIFGNDKILPEKYTRDFPIRLFVKIPDGWETLCLFLKNIL